MSTVPRDQEGETTSQRLAAFDLLSRRLRTSISDSSIRESLAAFLLLRWVDLQDAEQEAMAAFEGGTYKPLVPEQLQWRHWASLGDPNVVAERLLALSRYAESMRRASTHPMSTYLHALVGPLLNVSRTDADCLHEFVRWVDDLPFETPSERRALFDLFDEAIATASDPYHGEQTTPANIARLVAALANPEPGERVYDPCFGSGNFLVAAWQQAERSPRNQHRPGALLDVAGIEIDAGAFLLGLTRMILAGIEAPRLELGNSLERELPSSPSRQGFDVVLANPPIGVKTSRESGRYKHFAIPTSDITGLFVQHALAQLNPHGRAVIAVPEGFLFRRGADRELRRYLLEHGHVEAVIGLPAGSFAPYTSVKGSLLVLCKQGGVSRVRMADAGALFEPQSGSKVPAIRAEVAEQLARELRRPELRKPNKGHEESTPDRGLISRLSWELSSSDLEAAEWDLTPRRREKGGLDELLLGLREAIGGASALVSISEVAKVFAGRSIKSADLSNEPPLDRAMGYVRISDLSQGKVGRVSSWLRPELVSQEQRWALLPGDVLMSKSGTVGKAALVRNGAVGSIAASSLYVLRVDQKRLDAGFLMAYLASPACQNWLAAQSRGTVIQHLNRSALDSLPIVLPPLQMQARAAAQFREFGTDVLAFLAQATESNESSRVTSWLAELDSKVPKFVAGVDYTPALIYVEPLVTLASTAQRWLDQEEVAAASVRWLAPLTEALLSLAGASLIPPGPGLLNVLQQAERGIQTVLEQTPGHLPAESQARAIGERLSEWLRTSVTDLNRGAVLMVFEYPEPLAAGSSAELVVFVENPGVLPFRNVRIETKPDWGKGEIPFMKEGDGVHLILRGDVPKQCGVMPLRLIWQAQTLLGELVEDVIELPIHIVEPGQEASTGAAQLGGSPYVTGSPLEPKHGHSVFYGRDDLIAQISRQIATHGNVVLLEGNRRAGKTSILKHLEGQSVIPGWLAVYSSLQGAEGTSNVVGVPTVEVFREIARSIAMALTRLNIDVPLPNGQAIVPGKPALGVIPRACREGIGAESPFADFRDYLELVLETLEPMRIGVVLMLDEFDKLQEGIDSGVTSPQVPENIRYLIQTYPRFSAILTGSRRLKRLREEYWSALYGLGTSVQVTALDKVSARKVVVEPVRDRLTFSNFAVDRVLKLTARHPYLMQCLCNRVFDYAVQTKSRTITESVVTDSALGLVRDNEHFASLWDYAAQGPDAGRHRRQLILLLSALSFKKGTHIGFGTLQEQLAQFGVDVRDEALDVDLAYLRELELINLSGELGGGEYSLTIPLMADWIEQQQDADVVASLASTEAEEEDA